MNVSTVLEPACGNGAISRFLRDDCGANVVEFDLYTREGDAKKDFLTLDLESVAYDIIITNPPFSLAREFLQKCFHSGKPFVLLVPLRLFTAVGVNHTFLNFGFEVHVLVPSPLFESSKHKRPYSPTETVLVFGNFPGQLNGSNGFMMFFAMKPKHLAKISASTPLYGATQEFQESQVFEEAQDDGEMERCEVDSPIMDLRDACNSCGKQGDHTLFCDRCVATTDERVLFCADCLTCDSTVDVNGNAVDYHFCEFCKQALDEANSPDSMSPSERVVLSQETHDF